MRGTRNLLKGGSFVVVTALVLILLFHGKRNEELQDRVVSIVLERTGAVVCTGVLLDERTVLSASHCLEDFEAPVVRVRVRWGSRYSVKNILSHPTPSNLFPAGDLLMLELDKPVIRSEMLKPLAFLPTAGIEPGMELSVWGHSRACETCAAKEHTAKLLKAINGIWLPHLLVVSVKPETLCFTDSGGPAFHWKDGVWRLVGIVSGKMDLLTGPDLSCENPDVVLTLVDPYISWIEKSKRVDGPEQPDSSDFETLCRRPLARSAGLVYSILLDIVSEDHLLSPKDKLDLLLECKSAGALFEKRLERNPNFKFDSPVGLHWIDGFERLESLQVPGGISPDEPILRKMPLLRQ
jgi:hypothetical protein